MKLKTQVIKPKTRLKIRPWTGYKVSLHCWWSYGLIKFTQTIFIVLFYTLVVVGTRSLRVFAGFYASGVRQRVAAARVTGAIGLHERSGIACAEVAGLCHLPAKLCFRCRVYSEDVLMGRTTVGRAFPLKSSERASVRGLLSPEDRSEHGPHLGRWHFYFSTKHSSLTHADAPQRTNAEPSVHK